jgi:hypothetical protein
VSECEDYLLHIVSAWKEMSWQSFRKAFDTLYAQLAPVRTAEDEAASRLRWRALRLLDWMGHCDVSARGGEYRIFAAPAVVARLPATGSARAILCGARSPGTAKVLRSACERHRCQLALDKQPQDGSAVYVPRRIAFEAESDEAIASVAREINLAYSGDPLAWELVQFSGSLGEYLQSRPQEHSPELNWPRRDFDVKSLQFRPRGAVLGNVRLSVYEHPVRQKRLYQLWCGDTYQEVDRDWGRYAVLRHAGVNVLGYDSRRFTLAVSTGAPLPHLLARACALCTGFAPRFVRRALISAEPGGCYMFCEVPPVVALSVSEKLGQHLVYTALATPPTEVAR